MANPKQQASPLEQLMRGLIRWGADDEVDDPILDGEY